MGKEVCNQKVCKVNDNDIKILRILYNNPEGLRVKTIQKLSRLKQRLVYKRLELMKKDELVENIFPIWKISNGQSQKCATLLKDSNIFELHNLSYIVKLINKPDWWKNRKNYLIRLKQWQFKNVNFGKANSNPYQQLINDNFCIQCYSESIIIISRKRYYSNNPYETIKEAIMDVADLLDWFCERFRFKFFKDGIPHLEIRNNDFNRMKDHLAEFCKKNKNRFLLEIDKRRKVWIDMSEPFGKESNYPEAQERLEKVTKDILTKDPLLPSELSDRVKDLNRNFNEFESHINKISEHEIMTAQTMEQMSNNISRLSKELIEAKLEIIKLKGNS